MATALHLTGPVLVGPDEVRDEAWVVDGRITYAAPGPRVDATTVAGWVLPGLVDAHCHIGLDGHGGTDEATARQQAETDRDAGTLLIRDAGSPVDTHWVDDCADLPRLVRAGRHIARTRRYIRGIGHEIEPDQLVERVRIEARAGDGWVKLVGDWIDRSTGDLEACWPRDALTDAIAAAHEEGARVTAHCFGPAPLADFAAAGTDCIEHASGLEPDTIDSFAAQGIHIVPTLINIDTFPELAEPAREKFPDYHRRMLDLHARRHETFAAAREAGIAIHAGTDAGGGIAHGRLVEELEQLLRIGMSHTEALDAATWGARAWLGRPGLQEGESADLLVVGADPRGDVRVLRERVATVLRGRAV